MASWDFDDDGPTEEGNVRRLPWNEIAAALAARLRPHLRTLGWGTALLLLAVAAELGGPILLQRLIDRDIPAAVGSQAWGGILATAGIYLGLVALGSITTYAQVVLTARMGLEVVRGIKQDMFDHLLGLGADYFDHNPPGRLMARVESDAERLQVLFSEVTLSLLRTALLLVGTLAVMVSASPLVTLAVVGLVTPFLLAAIFFMRYMRGVYGVNRKLYARVSTFVTEYVQAVPILQVFQRTAWALAKLDARGQKRYRAESRSEFLGYGFWSLFYSVEVLAVMLILWLGFGKKLGAGLTLGTIVLFIEYTRRLFFPIVMFTEQLQFIQKALASADRVFGILKTESRVRDRGASEARIPSDWRVLRFEDVSFVYEAPDDAHPADDWDPSTLLEEEPTAKRKTPAHSKPGADEVTTVNAPARTHALRGVSFEIRRGQRVALVGPSGGGKSTITNLLLRFYEPTAGRITIDGVDLRDLPQKEWRERIGLVLQEIHLFPGSVADNLRVFRKEIPEERLRAALEALGGGESPLVLQHGLETKLAEGGRNLSMGERQLLSFARALVRDPDLLILDEATSSVDPVTERAIQESLDRLMSGRTSLVVAHRLSTVTSADQIVVLSQGRVVERGTHLELLRQRGVYQALFDLQFRAGEVTV